MLEALKKEIRDCLPIMRKIAAYADYDPAFGEEWAHKFSLMICDIEDQILAEQGEDGNVIPLAPTN